MTKAEIRIGWYQVFFSVLVLWGLNNVLIRYAATVLDANAIIYSCSSFVSSAVILLLIAGKGPLARETMRSIDTWGYGLVLLLNYLIVFVLFSYLTSTEGSLLQRISAVFSLLVGWVFLSRSPSKGQIIGTMIVLFGIVMVCRDLPSEDKGIIYLLMILEGGLLTARTFIAETHRPHKQAAPMVPDPRARCRVIGFVMLVISILFLSILLLFALAQNTNPESLNFPGLPTLQDFRHAPSIFVGLAAGVLFMAPVRYIEFSSASVIKAENFVAVSCLSSLATYFWEWLLEPYTEMSVDAVSNTDLWAMVLITIGAIIAAVSAAKKTETAPWTDYLEPRPQDPAAINDSREIVLNSLKHYNDNEQQTADVLNIPFPILKALLEDKKGILAFKSHILKNIGRSYRQNVTTKDGLTGLYRRDSFKAFVENLLLKKTIFSLLYIDLDKFKPVNDQYGHDAGDAVLKEVADRLENLTVKKKFVARLGGDEFCIVLSGAGKKEAEKIAAEVSKVMAVPFDVSSVADVICIGASVGVATYPEDGKAYKKLMETADKGMYQTKKSNQ